MFGPDRAASISSPSWQAFSPAAWQSTCLHWYQVGWATAGCLLLGLFQNTDPLPYIEPSIPENPGMVSGQSSAMMAHEGSPLTTGRTRLLLSLLCGFK